MAGVFRSELAKLDLVEIWEFIAQDSENAADRFLDLLEEKLDMLAEVPEAGRTRDDLAPGLLSFPVKRYVIYYRIQEQGIEVVRVLNAYRDVWAQFRRSTS